MQVQHSLSTVLPPDTEPPPVATPHPAFGHAVSRAYTEMSLGLRCLLHRYTQAQRIFEDACASQTAAAEAALLKAMMSEPTPSGAFAAEAAIRAAIESIAEAAAPPSLLLSRRNPLASSSLIAAAASPVFGPVKEILDAASRGGRNAQHELERSVEVGGRRQPSFAHYGPASRLS